MNVYETTSLDRYGRSSLAPIREDKELEGLKKKVEFEEKLAELEDNLSWRKLAKCLRYSSVLVNFLFIVLALAVMVSSLLIISEIRVFIPTLEDYVLLAVGAVFTIGAVILCVSSLGLYGAMKPNVCVLTLYLVAVIPALVGELAFCSIAWFRQATLKKLLDDLMKTLFAHYGDRAESLGLTATLILDAVQIWGGCCGNSTVSDWGDSEVATFWANSTNKHSEYPDSCCNKTTITDSTVDTTLPILDSYFHNCSQNTVANFLPDYFNNKGCHEEITGTLKIYTNLVTIVLFVLAIAQIIVIFVNTVLFFRKHPKAKMRMKMKVKRLKSKTVHRQINTNDFL